MPQTLSFFPGQQVTIFLETKDGYGVRTDCSELPVVSKILFPALTLASGYPQDMINIETGLYYYQFTLPTGATAVGNYLIDVSYLHPDTGYVNTEIYNILVSAPFGNYSASVTV